MQFSNDFLSLSFSAFCSWCNDNLDAYPQLRYICKGGLTGSFSTVGDIVALANPNKKTRDAIAVLPFVADMCLYELNNPSAMNLDVVDSLKAVSMPFISEWCLRHEKENKSFRYMRIISDPSRCTQVATLGEVAAVVTINACFRKLVAALNENAESILADYEEDNAVVVLGQMESSDATLAQMLNKFVGDFLAEKERAYRQEGTHLAAKLRRLDFCRESFYAYGHHTRPVDRGVFAKRAGVTRQRIDDHSEELQAEFRALLVDGAKVGRMKASETLVSRLAEFAHRIGPAVSKETFITLAGLKDERTREMLLLVLDMTMIDRLEEKIPMEYVVKSGSIGTVRGYLATFLDHFRHEVTSVRVRCEFEDWLSEIEDSEQRELFRSLVLNSAEFTISLEDGEEVVSMRWDLLQTIPARVADILHRKNAYGLHNAVKDTELVAEYNRLARIYKVKTITREQLPNSAQRDAVWRLMNVGNTGYYMLRNSPSEEFSLDSYIRSYILSAGSQMSCDALVERAKADGVIPIYGEKTVRSRYSVNGGVQVIRKTMTTTTRYSASSRLAIVDAAVKYLDENPGTITLKELHSAVCPEVNYTTFSMWLKNYGASRVTLVSGSGQTPTYVCSKGIAIEIPKTGMQILADKAYEIVSAHPDRKVEFMELDTLLKPYVPAGYESAKTAISKALHEDGRFLFVQSEEAANRRAVTVA